MSERPFQDQVTMVEQHADQLRADMMTKLFAHGAEYTEAMSDTIGTAIRDAQSEGNINKEIFATLAEIGWCDVFCRHARTIEASGPGGDDG